MINDGSKILCIFAHREDHVLFGWPILQNKKYERLLYLITFEALEINQEICKNENINFLGNAGLDNKFGLQQNMALPGKYKTIVKKLTKIIEAFKPDFIFTHNPMGEYGHCDHKLLFSVIYNTFNIPILITDVLVKSSHCIRYDEIPKDCQWCYKLKIGEIEPDMEFYKRNRKLFLSRGLWTSSVSFILSQHPKKVSLYLTNE